MSQREPTYFYDDSRRYDLVMGAFVSDDALNFYKRQIASYGEPVLELASGSGRLMIPLAQAGIDIIGIDRSKEMMALADEKAARLNLTLHSVEADTRHFDLGRQFNTILYPTQSMQHLFRQEDVEACLTCIRRHLTGNGRLIIEVFNPSLSLLSRDKNLQYPIGQYQNPDNDGQIIVTTQVNYDAATQINHIIYYYFDEVTKITERISFEMRQFYPQEINTLLEYNGFVIEHKYGDYNETVFSSNSMKQLIVCRVNTNHT